MMKPAAMKIEEKHINNHKIFHIQFATNSPQAKLIRNINDFDE